MSNARTLFHYFEIALRGAGVEFDSDMQAELMDALEAHDDEIERLRIEVSALRRQVPDNR